MPTEPDPFEAQLRARLRQLADQARPDPDARARLHRRARREPVRRLGVVAVSYAMVVAVVAVAFVGIRLQRDDEVAVPPDPGLTVSSASLPTTTSTTTPPSTAATTPTSTGRPPTSTAAPPGTTPPTGAPAPVAGFSDGPRRREHVPQAVPGVVRLDVGRHDDEGYDRVVIEFDGALPGYDVRYVGQLVQDGSGEPVSLRGAADLRITIQPANAHDDSGASTLPTRRLTPGYPAVAEARLVGDFEAVVTVGVGASARLPFRVTELSGPSRLVIDLRQPG